MVGALLALAPGAAAANSGTGSLAVNPAHGLASAYFSATFIEPAVAGTVCPAATVTFSWDGSGNQLGQAPLGGPDASGNCTAGISARPPSNDAAPGGHTVTGDDGSGNTGDATYTVDRPPPGPSPTPTHRPSPSPSPIHQPSPSPQPVAKPAPKKSSAAPAPPAVVLPASPPASPSPSCRALPPLDPVPGYHLVRFSGLSGDVESDPFVGWSRIWSTGPAALLPPQLGHGAFPAASLTKPVDGLSPALRAALRSGQPFDCVWVSLGPEPNYYFARYLFEQVRLTAVDVAGNPTREKVSFTYSAVFYDYLPRIDGGVSGIEVAGRGLYAPPVVAVANRAPWLLIGGGLAAVLVVVAGGGLQRRRLRLPRL